MSRHDDDTWDITEGVGATALTVARARAAESDAHCPLYTDPYAHFFIEAAAESGWQPAFTEETLAHIGKADDQVLARMKTMAAYIASRTKYLDEFFTTAGANGLDQVVILAAGLDTRAWRLPWISGTTIYELDQPKVLEFKEQVLRRHNARPATAYVSVPVDLRHDWPQALQQSGFDASRPTVWCAEGLLPYLSARDQDLLFERIDELSAEGSRLAVEAFGRDFYSPELMERRRERMAQARQAAADAGIDEIPDTAALWYIEARTDVADWLTDRDWEVETIDAPDLMEHYQRPPADPDVVPDTTFVAASKI
ncbi:putative S-adenosyl-L-methionine-dependent methyltransferase [Mycolicibacterium anyangense]|uniref:S-adenosyl-L-methionine-dependent methyltransferase n=1 Tax=Mycolicibacterium anyangense TaxID=1431246 RepID=A0A6N4WDZ7_9MYCO|nr:class I SAM-dependent methyltransferase [Mycolicibacterium anyangense]BBZ79309.1 putative S-adenosyl-L-methionine-dependent methyltransferase [Mycolicibacterium anyangense]